VRERHTSYSSYRPKSRQVDEDATASYIGGRGGLRSNLGRPWRGKCDPERGLKETVSGFKGDGSAKKLPDRTT